MLGLLGQCVTDPIVQNRGRADDAELRSAAMVERVALDPERGADPGRRIHRDRPGDNGGDKALERRQAPGKRRSVGLCPGPFLEFVGPHRRCFGGGLRLR